MRERVAKRECVTTSAPDFAALHPGYACCGGGRGSGNQHSSARLRENARRFSTVTACPLPTNRKSYRADARLLTRDALDADGLVMGSTLRTWSASMSK